MHKRESGRTGGGPPPPELSDTTKLVRDILGADSPVLTGILGGLESEAEVLPEKECDSWPREDWDVFSFQKLCADPGNMRPSIVLLERDVMEAHKWHNDRSQYLVAVSCCIQVAVDEVQPCTMSIGNACPHHNPTTTKGHSADNVSVGKVLADTTPYTLSTVGSEELEAGFVREEDSSPACQGPSKMCVRPL
ncbi:hypothetical protein SKAU_G00155600 [Synaphobranchus kaupii]|uniref:Uncharacterized protein n=1 Tax=Synaphobranchus kaupii TaxID=118154 RepID=A0A9Q1FHI5_SYNKA|nr:hypothetical protein SKAU_G00155600 [Synaphobranchus kaupii]